MWMIEHVLFSCCAYIVPRDYALNILCVDLLARCGSLEDAGNSYGSRGQKICSLLCLFLDVASSYGVELLRRAKGISPPLSVHVNDARQCRTMMQLMLVNAEL